MITGGTLGLTAAPVASERDMPDADVTPRAAGSLAALAFADRGVRSSVLRLPPTVHAEGDHGFVPMLIGIARDKGVSAYVGDGSNRRPAVHRSDAARLFRLALEQAPAGSILHGVAEEGIPIRTIAELIGRHLDVPTTAIAPDQAGEHFGWLSAFFATDVPTSSTLTRELLNWRPTGPGLVDDLDKGHYFHGPSNP
ncbi:hypothetical protein [Embleya sp. NPDC005575]|uniref:hypothetical protein n=1 Tax=Embleya sp. NPDC005575 TaxID=3156892 RepID=UPI0033B3CF94